MNLKTIGRIIEIIVAILLTIIGLNLGIMISSIILIYFFLVEAQKWKSGKKLWKKIKAKKEVKYLIIFISFYFLLLCLTQLINVLYNYSLIILSSNFNVGITNFLYFFFDFYPLLLLLVILNSILTDLEKKFDNFFIWCILFLLISIIIFGNNTIEKIYPSTFNFMPYSFRISSNNTFVDISCKSGITPPRGDPTVPDYMHCNMTFTNSNKESLIINGIQTYGTILPNATYSTNAYSCYLNLTLNKLQSCLIYIPLGPEGTHEFKFSIQVYYQNYSIFTKINSGFFDYTCFTEEQYQSRIFQKHTLLATIVIAGIFSVFSAVKNLMDIWGRENE